tara:strand:- start:1069 stop:1605 length:537 start_codon:yes stop_codon:yes gene_type:complete
MNQPAAKKSNYVNVNLNILNGIFANKSIPIVCGKKWCEIVGIVPSKDSGQLILLSIDILEKVFADKTFAIPVSRRWLESLYITIEVEAAPIVIDQASFSVAPVATFDIPDLGEVKEEEKKVDDSPSGAVSFGETEEEETEEAGPSGAVSFGEVEEEHEEVEETVVASNAAPKTAYSQW